MTAKQFRHTCDLLTRPASRPVTIQVAGSNHQGWIHAPAEATEQSRRYRARSTQPTGSHRSEGQHP